jgi:gliding motility-associated-like protein
MRCRNVHIIKHLFVTMMAVMTVSGFSQKPEIKSHDHIHGANHDIITLHGSNFGNDKSSIGVYFGAVKGTIKFLSDQIIEVYVPSGTTYFNISVVNKSNGLTGYGHYPFYLSFNGTGSFTDANLEGQKDFSSESGLYDLCLCDFDGDGKSDIAASSQKTANVSVFRNTSTPGISNIIFNKSVIQVSQSAGVGTLHAQCGDLNGDGKAEIILSGDRDAEDQIIILENTSSGGSISFTKKMVQIVGRKIKRIDIADLDNDGKPELIATSQSTNFITVLINQSTAGSVSFSNSAIAQIQVTDVPADRGFDGLVVQDLNNDGKPDLLFTQFLTFIGNVYLVPNISTPGNVQFGAITVMELSGTPVNLKVGDLDGDLKPDIAATVLLNSSVAIFKNQSTGNEFTFASPVQISTVDRPYGLDMGDLDGDGKLDIAVASISKKLITVLSNASTSAGISFQKITKTTTYINRHITIGDIDGDGKPDISFTSIDDGTNGIPASKISIFRNNKCIVPKISPEGPKIICAGSSILLSTTSGEGLIYQWKNGASPLVSDSANFEVTAAGNYTVNTTSSVDAGCNFTSNNVEVAIEDGTSLTGKTAIETVEPVCIGSHLHLKVVTDVGASLYQWSGPSGFSATGLQAEIPDFQLQNAGRYHLKTFAGENKCFAQDTSMIVDRIDIPDFTLNASAVEAICGNTSKSLSVAPVDNTYSYQWFERSTGLLGGKTGTSLTVTTDGEYFVKVTASTSCSPKESTSSKIIFTTTPVVSFSAPPNGCKNYEVIFTDATNIDPKVTASYKWVFGDGEHSSERNPLHTFRNVGSFSVNLTISYDHEACAAGLSKSITIETKPDAFIKSESDKFSVCPDGILKLSLNRSFASYLWSTGQTTPEIDITAGGPYNVKVNTGTGCEITVVQQIETLSAPSVAVSADPLEIVEGQSTNLTVTGLTSKFLWSPEDGLSNTAIASPIATPVKTITYAVSGQDENGCAGEGSIEIIVKDEKATKKILPAKFFSPDNGDDLNNFWTVEKILDYPHCEVSIYDDKGVKVYHSKPYNNDWDGTYNGKRLPDGVYYYVIKCSGEENSPKTGSITMLR